MARILEVGRFWLWFSCSTMAELQAYVSMVLLTFLAWLQITAAVSHHHVTIFKSDDGMAHGRAFTLKPISQVRKE